MGCSQHLAFRSSCNFTAIQQSPWQPSLQHNILCIAYVQHMFFYFLLLNTLFSSLGSFFTVCLFFVNNYFSADNEPFGFPDTQVAF